MSTQNCPYGLKSCTVLHACVSSPALFFFRVKILYRITEEIVSLFTERFIIREGNESFLAKTEGEIANTKLQIPGHFPLKVFD